MSVITSEISTAISFVVDTNNNTVLSANFAGTTFTGAQAKQEFDSLMGLFGLEAYYSDEIGVFTDSAYFTNQGTTTMTFGQVSFPVTTYGLNNPSGETVNYCGVAATINSYTLSVGTPPGSTLLFITYLNFSGTSNGSTGNFTFQLLSMTAQG